MQLHGLKYTATEETNNYSLSTTYKISNSKLGVFTDAHILHYKTGNVQTEKFGFGNYKDIFQDILHNEAHKENIVKRIFETVQNKENSHLVLPKKINNFAEQLTHLLFIIEIQRNNTTLFTAPMFLELTIQNSKYLKKEGFFPMSAKNAVSQARGIVHHYSSKLLNSHFMDYDMHNVIQGEPLLKSEGHILIKWLKKAMINNKLNNITHIFNIISSLKIISIKKTDLLNLKEIQIFINDIKKLPNCSVSLFKVLEEH